MNKLVVVSAALLSACTAYADESLEATPQAQDRLAAALDGRVAGPAVSCVQRQRLRGHRVIDDRTILFDTGSTVYLNRTRSTCEGLRDTSGIRSQSTGTSMCDGEILFIFDTGTGVEHGGCALGEFVPYRRRG